MANTNNSGRGYARPLAGLTMVLVLAGVVALAAGLFQGSFTKTVPLTLISDRAGLVMNPDAKVKIRGVQVGKVAKIESRPDGTAALELAMDPGQMRLIPKDVTANIASSTVFGAKFVDLVPAPDVTATTAGAIEPGTVLRGDHVTVEINTVFEQLTGVLNKVDPIKLNETLGAISTAVDGRGEQIGQALSDFSNFLGKIDPSLDNMEYLTTIAPEVFRSYADAASDLMGAIDNTSTLSNSIVDEQNNLDAFLLSATGLANLGDQVLGDNREGLTNLAHVLLPTSALLDQYHEELGCAVGGLVPFAKAPPFPVPGIIIAASFVLGEERYRYPNDLPKVAAKADKPLCEAFGLPNVPPEFRPPGIIADIGARRDQYGNQGILLNSDALKNWLYGPLGGPPRNSAQVGMPG